jgi:hypothetical protein
MGGVALAAAHNTVVRLMHSNEPGRMGVDMGWTRADVNRIRGLMAEQGRTVDDIAAELRAFCGCTPLAAYRLARGLSQPEVVEQFRTQTGSYLDQPTLSRMEQWPGVRTEKPPRAAHLVGLAAVYDTAPHRLVAPSDLDKLSVQDKTIVVRYGSNFTSQSESTAATNGYANSENVHSGETDKAVAMAARRALRFAATAEGSNLGQETLDNLRAEVAHLSIEYIKQPPAQLLGDLIDTQDIAFRLLEGRQRPEQAQELYLLTGALTAILAEASHHLGDPHAAMAQARTAVVCAENAGHNGLQAYVRGIQSLISYWAGWPHRAIQYAELGSQVLSEGTASVWLPLLEARAAAVLGDSERAEAALLRAASAREAGGTDELDQLGGTLTLTRPWQMYLAADARVWLPDSAARAEAEAIQAVEACKSAPQAERSYAFEAGAWALLALARVGRGEIEGAREALAPVLDLPSERRVGGVVGTAVRIHAALLDPSYQGSAPARQVLQEIEAWSERPAAVALPRGR